MVTKLGKNIKKIREQKDISLERLATTLRLDYSYLESIENELTEPAVSNLLKIANALGTDISTLIYGKEFTEKKVLVNRPQDRIRVDRKKSFNYESLAPYFHGRHMEPFIIEVYPQELQNLEFSNHVGEEFHYVLEGTVVVVINEKEHVISTGDSIYFDSSSLHSLYAIDKPARLISTIYNGESMLHLTRSKHMRGLIQAAKLLGGKNVAVVCPNATVLKAVNKGIEEGVIGKAFLIGDKELMPEALLQFADNYEIIPFSSADSTYFKDCAEKGVALVRESRCQMLMKGQINTALFVKEILNKEKGIRTGRRLSLISMFELPFIDRLIFLTDPGINTALVADNNFQSSIDIIKNAIDIAKALGVVRPRVALLEANEMPSEKIPTTLFERQLSEMHWDNADVYGPLSYDLALYEESIKNKGFGNNPVAGKADILVVPYISGGNFLYKAWTMTLNAEVASIVVGAQVPLIMTSRNDNNSTKFLTICAGSVFSQYLQTKVSGQ